ncbi:hypothetical protein [Candidatus Mycobacterium methanotrophicum]|nr:hypothetical protein [Candidatus Mycobacterium methanotrophicum]
MIGRSGISETAGAVPDDDQAVVATAAAYGCTWNTCDDAVAATADPVLGADPRADQAARNR